MKAGEKRGENKKKSYSLKTLCLKREKSHSETNERSEERR